MSITYRTNDNTRWGTGQGSDLSAAQIDINFWELFSAVTSLQDHASTAAGIDYFVIAGGNQLYVHLTNHAVIGPYTIPTAQWRFRGEWQPDTVYGNFDVITEGGATYLVIFAHTSANASPGFDPGASDGMGHNYYGLLIAPQMNALPAGGAQGTLLAKNSATNYDTKWIANNIVLGIYFEGGFIPDEVVLEYVFTETVIFPIGLAGSQGNAGLPPTTDQVFTLFKNGSSIGTVAFNATDTPTFSFTAAVTFIAGDILSIVAPFAMDAHMEDVAISLVAARQ